MYISLYVKYPLFLTHFNKTWIFLVYFRKIFKYQIPYKSVPLKRVVPSGWTGRQENRRDKANSRFAILRTRVKRRSTLLKPLSKDAAALCKKGKVIILHHASEKKNCRCHCAPQNIVSVQTDLFRGTKFKLKSESLLIQQTKVRVLDHDLSILVTVNVRQNSNDAEQSNGFTLPIWQMELLQRDFL